MRRSHADTEPETRLGSRRSPGLRRGWPAARPASGPGPNTRCLIPTTVTCLTVLRAHLLIPERRHHFLARRECTAPHLVAVCHRPPVLAATDRSAVRGTAPPGRAGPNRSVG